MYCWDPNCKISYRMAVCVYKRPLKIKSHLLRHIGISPQHEWRCVCVGLVPWAIKVIPLYYTHQQVCVCVFRHGCWLLFLHGLQRDAGEWPLLGKMAPGNTDSPSLRQKTAYISIPYILSPVNDWKRGEMSSVVIFAGYRFSRGPENVGETCQHPLICQTQVTWPCLSHDLRIFLPEETRLLFSSIVLTLILCFPNQLHMQNLLEYATCYIWVALAYVHWSSYKGNQNSKWISAVTELFPLEQK